MKTATITAVYRPTYPLNVALLARRLGYAHTVDSNNSYLVIPLQKDVLSEFPSYHAIDIDPSNVSSLDVSAFVVLSITCIALCGLQTHAEFVETCGWVTAVLHLPEASFDEVRASIVVDSTMKLHDRLRHDRWPPVTSDQRIETSLVRGEGINGAITVLDRYDAISGADASLLAVSRAIPPNLIRDYCE